MKKIVYAAAIVCMLAAVVSCKSTKAGKKSGKKGKAPVVTEVAAEGAAAEGSEAAVEGAAEAASSAQPGAEGSSETSDKDFSGWIKGSKKNINERFGKVQIKIKAGFGSYTLAVLNEKEKPVPVLSTSNEYVTNAFFLKNSKKIYNLVTDNAVKSSAKRTTDGAVLLYEIPTVAQVSVNFSCFSSEKDKETDMVKVTVSVKNISNRNDEFAIKAILDTVLGEAAAYHFYTYDDVPVKSEVLYRTLQNQKWFVSKNINGAMQLFFSGADCTVPELVALANYSTLEKNSWEPDMLSYRVFDTVLSYNNSAVCSIWKPIKLAPTETGKVVFYIAMNGNGTPATGEKFIYSKEFEKKPEEEKSAGAKVNSASALEVITPYSVDEPVKVISEPDAVTEISVNEPVSAPVVEKQPEIPSVDFYIKNMTKEHLTPEYIQSLLDRIAALEEDSPSLNRQELLQLNAELDATLTYLRQ